MLPFEQQIEHILARRNTAPIVVLTLGGFQVWREGSLVQPKDWGRDKSIQLFQFLVTARHRKALHKEQIIDRLWDGEGDDQTFKVALHGINKALEPDRKSHTEARFIGRQGLTYQLIRDNIWTDADAMEALIAIGNQCFNEQTKVSMLAYRAAIALHNGVYLPDRIYEDWSCDERERLQILALGALTTLSELLLDDNPMESIRLTQQALRIDHAWEDAYRIQMAAWIRKGNRPMAIKTYQQCEKVLMDEMGIQPLPETRRLFNEFTML